MEIDNVEDLIDQVTRSTVAIEREMEILFDSEEGKNIKADIELLNSMGFNKKMINKVYLIFKPENIERAVDYMTEIYGVYQHIFIEGRNPNECFICKRPRKNHIDRIPHQQLNNNMNNNNFYNHQNNNLINHNQNLINIEEENIDEDEENNNYNNNDDESGKDECEVCYEELYKEDRDFNRIPCGHLFCTNCWFNYLKTSISEAKVNKIKCMDHGCNQIISERFILQHIKDNNNLVEKYKKLKKRAEILKDKDKKLCPKPDCDSYLKKSNKSKYVRCQNGHEYCFDCLNPPHGNKPCDQKLEKQFMKWKKGKRVKRCPRCQIYTEKNEGCNHMNCVNCK